MKPTFLFFVFLFFGTNLLMSQNFDTHHLDKFFNVLEKNEKFNGSVLLTKNGKLLYERSLGFADFENQIKNNAQTKFRIGSISKTFTATLILKAVENGKLDLYKPIHIYFPNLKNAEKITLKNLLNHSSGVRSFTDDPSYLSWNNQPKTQAELLDIILSYDSEFEPGSKHNYSNSNYVLLSLILEKLYKKSFGEILEDQITKPLGLTSTKMGGKIQTNQNEANSYKKVNSWAKDEETDMSIPLGAGAIISTTGDLIKFGEALFSGQIINKKYVDEMTKFQDSYGFGLFEFPFYDKILFGHTGGIDSFTSVWGYNPADKISFVILSNGTQFDNNSISIALLSAAYNKPIQLPNFTKLELKSEDLDKYLGTYSNPDFPLKITISKNGNQLVGQATGQGPFPLNASAENEFKFEEARISILFQPENNTFEFSQAGLNLLFTKE